VGLLVARGSEAPPRSLPFIDWGSRHQVRLTAIKGIEQTSDRRLVDVRPKRYPQQWCFEACCRSGCVVVDEEKAIRMVELVSERTAAINDSFDRS
jgi:hypothetical protein